MITQIYRYLLFFELGLAFITFFYLLKFVAPYGRYVTTSNKNNVSKRSRGLSHRMGWLIMEIPAVFTILILFLISPYRSITSFSQLLQMPIIVLFLWEIHYLYRTFIFPFLSRNKKNKFPVYIVISGAIFNIINGFINGWFLFFVEHNSTYLFSTIHFWLGLALFFIGYIIHIVSDAQLRKVKKINNDSYGIPHNFLHRYVSSPNYLGELIQWFGLFILSYSPAMLVFVIFTWANLAPRALSHNKWYMTSFSDYPKTRKAIIPFLL